MRISEVSRRTGVSIRSLRYYEQKRLLCARRLENGYRDLDEEAVKRVQTIQMYLGLGLTTEQIEEILQCAGGSPLPRSEEHTSELQSLRHLVCRLLLEKKHEEDRARA